MVLNLWDKLNGWSESFKNYMVNNDRSVLLYTGLFILGLAIFAFTYNKLNKDDK